MACLNCLNCMSYQEDGLGANFDPDSILRCTSFNNLAIESDIKTNAIGVCTKPSIDSSCDNALKETCSGEIWADPKACFQFVETNSFIPIDIKLPPDVYWTSPSASIVLPPNNTCYPCSWRISVRRRFYFSQTDAANYIVSDQVFNTPLVAPVQGVNIIDSSHITIIHNGFSWEYTQNPNTGGVAIPFNIELFTSDNVTEAEIFWIYYQFSGIGICNRGCPL